MRADTLRRRAATADDGITLVELVVTMGIMAVCMIMFTGGIVQLYRSAGRAESMAGTQSTLALAFQRLGKEIHYASAISRPGRAAAGPSVEFLTANTATPVCTQLLLDNASHRLRRRTWPQGAAPGRWTVLASGVGSAQPFTLLPADVAFAFQRLRVRLSADAGPGRPDAADTAADVTFTAFNTSPTTSTSVCSEGRTTP
ncbi:PulJ/GspJ family protein [Spirillospora sp. CA-253888]